jgi:hypothetical protein
MVDLPRPALPVECGQYHARYLKLEGKEDAYRQLPV